LIKSLCDTLVPKLVAEDIPLLSSLLTGVFPGSSIIQIREERLIEQLEKLASKYNLVCKAGNPFIEKVL
jgi:dynein heavy chain 1